MIPNTNLNLSGTRFTVWYRIKGNAEEARAKAENICNEQTVEFPTALIPDGPIRDQIIGKIESLEPLDGNSFLAKISFAIETTAFDLTQTLNVIFGNISLQPGIRVENLDLPSDFLKRFIGPRYGCDGLRKLLNIPKRPLLCTAVKPMGLSPSQLGDLVYQFALGGIDMIKDDHGLSNQPFAPFQERVKFCTEAVERANRQTGRKCIYIPNVTGPVHKIMDNAYFAKQMGAGALLINPGLTGLDAIRCLAEDDQIALPIISHPSFQGSLVTNHENGISHYVIFGQIPRLAGADGSIYPNYGGRFSFNKEECQQIVKGTSVPMEHIKPIFPVPGGGMNLSRFKEMVDLYGSDIILLIGGGLHQQGPDLVENCRYFLDLAEKITIE